MPVDRQPGPTLGKFMPLATKLLTDSRRRRAQLSFCMVLAALLFNAIIAYMNLSGLQQSLSRSADSREILLQIAGILSTTINAETGMRGYVITGDPDYKAPYQLAVATLNEKLQRLELAVADDATEQTHFQELSGQIVEFLQITERAVAARDERGIEYARELMLQGAGKRSMDSVRLTMGKMEREEQARLARNEAIASQRYYTALASGIIGTVLGVGLIATGYFVVLGDLSRREKAAVDLQEAHDLLEIRVGERMAPIAEANEILRHEIEDRRRAEAQVTLIAHELQRSNRELEQFASVASHDLQEPLRKIQAFGDRLRDRCREELGELGRDYLDRILASSGRMRKLIDDLLAYSRVSTKSQPFSAISLADIAHEVAADLEGRLQETGGKVQIGDLPMIEADPLQMRQLMQNLIGNSLKFHRADAAPVVQVSSRVYQDGDGASDAASPLQCEIVVQDNGIGFDQNYVDRIFDLFQRLHGRNEYEGTGMGLAICRKIVERHGGQITAQSAPNEGAKFLVTLPVAHLTAGAT
jgi:signal transduction histidine kinase